MVTFHGWNDVHETLSCARFDIGLAATRLNRRANWCSKHEKTCDSRSYSCAKNMYVAAQLMVS